MKTRIWMSCLGVAVSGVSVGMFRTAALGVDPFQSFMSGLNGLIPIRFGTLYVIVNAVLLLFALVFDRRKIGLATVINLTLLGYVVEWSQRLFTWLLPSLVWWSALLLLAVGLVTLCFGAALYFNADLGVSTYDAVSLIVSEKQSKVSFRLCRILSDLICVSLAVLMCRIGGMSWRQVTGVVGVGTVATAFFMGPLIAFFSARLPLSRR